MSDKPQAPSKELLQQIEKILNPVGPLLPPGALPNLTPVKEKKKHKEKKASVFGSIGKIVPGSIGEHLRRHSHAYDLAGLGVLAAPAAVELGHEASKEKGQRDIGTIGKSTAEIGGLGLLAAPIIAQMRAPAAEALKHASVFDELAKIGFVTDQQAMDALDQLQTLEDTKPTGGQVARGMALGAVAKPTINVLSNAIKGGGEGLLEGTGVKGKLRALAAHAAQGALGGGAMSIAQNEVERRHALGKLKGYMAQYDDQKTAAELTPEARSKLPKKTFAVPSKKSNTGKPAYPIHDEQHARSALGFAKMHGDTADYERVRAKVKAKYPHLIKD